MKNLLILAFGLILFTSCNNKKGITLNDVQQGCKANDISNEQLADLLYSNDMKGVQFVDIRTPHEYAVSHLSGAINVPMKNFFNKKYFNKISKDDILILYGEDASSPRLMALMASHFKKGKFYVALGGYDYIKNKIMNGYFIYSGLYNDEVPLVDFAQAVNDIKSRYGGGGVSKSVKKSAPAKPIVKHKKKEVTGGCG